MACETPPLSNIPRQKAMIYIESIRGREADGTRGLSRSVLVTEGGCLTWMDVVEFI